MLVSQALIHHLKSTLFEGLIWHDDDDEWNVRRLRPVPDKMKLTPNDPRSSMTLLPPRPQMTSSQGGAGGGGDGDHEFDEYYGISYHQDLD